jgi:hypothetical protein
VCDRLVNIAGSTPLYVEFLKGAPTTLVAIAVAIIAWRQYSVAQAKLKLDLFERRYSIFEQTWKILSSVIISGTREKNYGLATPFNNFLPQARFLFGPDVSKYLDEASSKWAELNGLETEGIAGNPGNIEKARVLKNWFENQATERCKAIFDPYLSFKDWK